MRILLLEENNEGREVLARILKKNGFSVLQAENPATALRMLRSALPLNLMIAGAAGRDRTEFLSDMRHVRRDLPAIFLADYCKPESVARSPRYGAFLVSRAFRFSLNTRPISLDELHRMIRIALRGERGGNWQALAA